MHNSNLSMWFYEYSNDIYHFLIYYLSSRDVEDLVQEVFIRAFNNIDSIEEKASPKTWLFSIARHVAIDEVRRRKRVKFKQLLMLESEVNHELHTPEYWQEIKETQRELYQAIHKLKKEYREVIILRGIKEFSVEETAEILGWKVEKVSLTFHRAIHALQKEKARFL